jgi:hypothetical protein
MSKAQTIHLPGDLLAAALKVPDFQAKLEQFTRTEVALHRFRKARYSPESLKILAKAKQAAAGATIHKKDRAAKVTEFLQLCDTMLPARH